MAGFGEKKYGWDLPLDENLYASVIDHLSCMDNNEYLQMRSCVIAFISAYLSNDETQKRYLNMFQL